MLRFLAGRLGRLLPTVVAVVTLIFFLFQAIPGDQAALLAGPTATDAEVQRIRRELGLDRPLWIRYCDYFSGILQGEFGYSTTFQGSPLVEVARRLPASLALMGAALGLTVLLGVPLGTLTAVYHRRLLDQGVSILVAVLLAVPNFWLGLMLMSLFAVQLRWLPSFGFTGWASVVLPALALAARLIALVTRLTRGVVLDELRKDYVRTARAKGLSSAVVIRRHVLRNALIPVLTVIGLQTGYLLGGSVVVERLFAWPGIGDLMINAIGARDYNLVQGVTLLYVTAFLVVNLIVDSLYFVANPRLRSGTLGG